MPELVREWPRLLERVLTQIRPVAGCAGRYMAEVDLSEDELRALNLFEASARHEHVSFKDPLTSEEYFAYLNTPIGLGKPQNEGGCIARVRISFTAVQRIRPVEARSDVLRES
ncbi:hypothetical protein [Microvirga sp. 2TAF3]|uniref:hypothetical protein n=1 Tax=Microvirga sp. 2TAF3 TaxID=3233014 RepID=UPI003F994DF5